MRILVFGYLIFLASGVLSQETYLVTPETASRIYDGSYIGIEYSAWVESRSNLQLQYSRFLTHKDAVSLKFGYILKGSPKIRGFESKAQYSRVIAGFFYLGAGMLYQQSKTSMDLIVEVDDSFYQEVAVVQDYSMLAGFASMGLLIPLTTGVILDMNGNIATSREHYSGINNMPTSAKLVGRQVSERLLLPTQTDYSATRPFINIDLAIIFKL